MAVNRKLDAESLVARLIAELQENPEAQRLLLRALLTNEFLGMPARLDRIEKDVAELKVDVRALKADVAELKSDVAELKTNVAELKTTTERLETTTERLETTTKRLVVDVGDLKGDALEVQVHRKVRSLICQSLSLRRPQVLQSAFQSPSPEFDEAVGRAAEEGRISERQEDRIVATGVILQAQRRADRKPVWVAIEVSHRVAAHDIDRAGQSAEALATVFGGAVIAAVAGRECDPRDRKRAAAADVRYVQVPA